MDLKDIVRLIQERKSVRSYEDFILAESQKETLLQSDNPADNPFGMDYTIRLKSFDVAAGFKPSTYGFIKGATDFFLMGIGEGESAMLAAGFGFEHVVLKATEMGLGTCWIGGTFKGSDFDINEGWPDGQSLKIISPVGKGAKPRLMEKIGRKAMGSDNRKPFEKLFFTDRFTKALKPDSEFGEALGMMRLAPSSTNSQPWRACVENDIVHFYSAKNGGLSDLDCGIGLCHFYLFEKYSGRGGHFFKASDFPVSPEGWRYVYSYKR